MLKRRLTKQVSCHRWLTQLPNSPAAADGHQTIPVVKRIMTYLPPIRPTPDFVTSSHRLDAVSKLLVHEPLQAKPHPEHRTQKCEFSSSIMTNGGDGRKHIYHVELLGGDWRNLCSINYSLFSVRARNAEASVEESGEALGTEGYIWGSLFWWMRENAKKVKPEHGLPELGSLKSEVVRF